MERSQTEHMAPSAIDELMLPVSGTLNQPVSVPNMALLDLTPLDTESGESGTTAPSLVQVQPRTQCLPMVDDQCKQEPEVEEGNKDGNRKRMLTRSRSNSPTPTNKKTVFELSPLKKAQDENVCVKKDDPWFDVKNCILFSSHTASQHYTVLHSHKKKKKKRTHPSQTAYTAKGPDLKLFTKLCNIFLKGWRLSKQLNGMNQRSRQKFYSVLTATVGTLYERGLIAVRGPESEINITKMIVTEIRQDNSKLIMLAPPMLSILVTEELFNKYFNNSNTPHGEVRKLVKTVSLGAATEQWHKLQEDLSLESGAQLAGILLHCYNAWSSIACGKCRRHMEVGMGRQAGKSINNSLCIVQCECGKSTSGGFMIECDQCHKWQHGVCVNINQEKIPDAYTCPKCKKGMFEYSNLDSMVEDAAAVESDTSVVSIDNEEVYSTDESGPEVIELD